MKTYIYIVKCNRGDYDDYVVWVDNVYSTLKKAQKRKKYLENQTKKAESIKKPSGKRPKLWHEWHQKYYHLIGRECFIVKYILR